MSYREECCRRILLVSVVLMEGCVKYLWNEPLGEYRSDKQDQ